MPDCPFCDPDKNRVIAESETCFAIRDAFPVTVGHSLIIPIRHVSNALELEEQEWSDLHRLLKEVSESLQRSDQTISGFNVGINVDEDAGQTVMHAHVHLIPRRKGDVEHPRGGIRHLIPGKGHY